MSRCDMPRVNPDKPESWPSCACGDPGSYLERVKDPSWQNPKAEGRIGDYSGYGRTITSRYIVLCDGCREMAIELDTHIALVESIRFRDEAQFQEEATHDE